MMQPLGNFFLNGIETQLLYDEDNKCEVELIFLDSNALIHGSKNYVILDCSDVEEFTSKIGSLGTLLDYLRGSVPELQVKAYWLNSLVPEVLSLNNKNDRSELDKVQIEKNRLELYRLYSDFTLTDLEKRYNQIKFDPEKTLERRSLQDNISQLVKIRRLTDHDIEQLKEIFAEAIDETSDQGRIIKAYLQYGVGACFLITIRSEYYYVQRDGLEKAIQYVIKDLRDYDVVIKQRAKQGFHLLIEELDIPSMLLTANTILNPNILGKLSKAYPELQPLFQSIKEKFVFKLTQDVQLKNRKLEKSLSLTQALSSLLRRSVSLDESISLIPQPEFERTPSSNDINSKRLIYLGLIAKNGFKPSENPAFFELDKLVTHGLISGGTGSGKSVVAKVFAEGCLLQGVSVTVFDATRQWLGFLKACENKVMLKRYKEFGLRPDDARSFNVQIFDNKKPNVEDLFEPSCLNVILIDKFQENEQLDAFVYDVMNEVFWHFTKQDESNKLRSLFVVEEAYRLAPREKGAPHKAIDELGRCVRELRKYGVGLFFLAQQISDFAAHVEGGLAIRGNPALRIQLKTNYEGDINRIRLKHGTSYAELIPKLPTGVGMIDFSDYGNPYFVCFRPLLHEHCIISDEELQKLTKSKVPRDILEKVLFCDDNEKRRNFQDIPTFSDEEKLFLKVVLSFDPQLPMISDVVKALQKERWRVGKVYDVKNKLEEKGAIEVISERGKKLVKVALSGKDLENTGISKGGDFHG
ncbi:MAG: helicase HerA-like domain-containing protein [Nitrososphaerales archaeon]